MGDSVSSGVVVGSFVVVGGGGGGGGGGGCLLILLQPYLKMSYFLTEVQQIALNLYKQKRLPVNNFKIS